MIGFAGVTVFPILWVDDMGIGADLSPKDLGNGADIAGGCLVTSTGDLKDGLV
jgi:hypothetical protein